MANTKRKIIKTENAETLSENAVEQKIVSKRLAKKTIPLNTMVECVNLTRGKLIYISSKSMGYQVTWGTYGDSEPIELSELMSMRNSQKAFFENNWITMDDDIIRYLGVEAYYTNVPKTEDFDSIFNKSPKEIIETVSKFSKGLKETIAIRAVELIESGELDSRKSIDALEKALSIELIER